MSSKVTINGRLTKDPELRFTNGGKAVAQFSVVTSRRYKDNQTQEWTETDTSYWDVTAFGDMAENICESLQKGSAVIVTGAMRQEVWTDKEDKERRAWRVLADDVGTSIKWRKNDKVTPTQRATASYSDEPPF